MFLSQRNKQHELGTKPILKNEKPGIGELKFIDFVVTPLYEQLVILNPLMQPLLDQVKVNKQHWKNVSEGNDPN